MSTVLDSCATHLSFLLDRVCRAIQLTETQQEDARQKYEAVSAWLAAPESALRVFDPQALRGPERGGAKMSDKVGR